MLKISDLDDVKERAELRTFAACRKARFAGGRSQCPPLEYKLWTMICMRSLNPRDLFTRRGMERASSQTIRIAAALIDDGSGRLLLVRKTGTQWFMQAGGKIQEGESSIATLRRELLEEIGLSLPDTVRYLGRFSAPAANEPDHVVDAEIFHVRVQHTPETKAEIAEAVWVDCAEADSMPLAPLTRHHILPLAFKL